MAAERTNVSSDLVWQITRMFNSSLPFLNFSTPEFSLSFALSKLSAHVLIFG